MFSCLGNVHAFINARSHLSWKRLRESALHKKYGSETNCTEVVRCDSNIDPRTKFGDLESVRIKLVSFEMGEVAPSSDRTLVQLMKSKVHVFSDSVLCVGKMSQYPQSNIIGQTDCCGSTPQNRELDGIDGEPMEFDWRIFPKQTTLQILQKIHTLRRELNCEPEPFPRRTRLMSMYNDIDW